MKKWYDSAENAATETRVNVMYPLTETCDCRHVSATVLNVYVKFPFTDSWNFVLWRIYLSYLFIYLIYLSYTFFYSLIISFIFRRPPSVYTFYRHPNWNDRNHTHLFFPATSWKWHSSKLQNCPLCLSSLQRSRDVTTDIYIFNILNSVFYLFSLTYLSIFYIYYIHLFIYLFLFIHLLFFAVRRPPSVIRHPPSPSAVHFLSFYSHPLQRGYKASEATSRATCFALL